MYVIVDIAGQQFKVSQDQELFVHKLQDVAEGAQVEFDQVLLVDNNSNITVGTPIVQGAKVTAKVLETLVKGDKVIVFKKKRRKGYERKKGHRQQFTKLQITSISI